MFGATLKELVDAENDITVWDDTVINWNDGAEQLLNNTINNEVLEEESDNEVEHEKPPSFEKVLAQIAGMQKLASNHGMIKVLEQLSQVASEFESKFLEKRNESKQTCVTDFFSFK